MENKSPKLLDRRKVWDQALQRSVWSLFYFPVCLHRLLLVTATLVAFKLAPCGCLALSPLSPALLLSLPNLTNSD